jgi:hydrogenase expression/formation protein HypC
MRADGGRVEKRSRGPERGDREGSPTVCHPGGYCATCADEGLEGRILRLLEGNLAEVEIDGKLHAVAVDLVDAAAGDRVLVHAGVALARLEG